MTPSVLSSMKGWFLLAACACAPPRAPTVTLAAAPVTAAATVVGAAPPPPGAVLVSSTRDASWARAFPQAKDFKRLETKGKPLLVLWRLGAAQPFRPEGADEDFVGPPMIPVELTVGTATLSLGTPVGSVTPASVSYCQGTTERTPTALAVVSKLSVGTMQGDSEFMIVRNDMTLHVLHRETSDGRCDEAKQGPLDVCEGFEWERVADIHLASDAPLYERVDDEKAPFDCNAR